MSKRCELQKEYYKVFGSYKIDIENYIKWLEDKIIQSKLSELEKKNNELLKSHSDWMTLALERKDEITKLNEIIKEAINLPKGVEPHDYSDYKMDSEFYDALNEVTRNKLFKKPSKYRGI